MKQLACPYYDEKTNQKTSLVMKNDLKKFTTG